MARTDTLGNFLTDVADAIRTAEGSSETIQASDFDTRIEALSGGGNNPTSLSEYNEMILELAEKYQEYVNSFYTANTTYTEDAVTLYTPNAEFKYYVIMKRNNQYRICWLKSINLAYANGNLLYYGWLGSTTSPSIELKDLYSNVSNNTMYGPAYYSPTEATIEALIQKVMNNELTYTYSASTSLGYQTDTPRVFPYTNAILYSSNVQDTNQGRISQNETIVAME